MKDVLLRDAVMVTGCLVFFMALDKAASQRQSQPKDIPQAGGKMHAPLSVAGLSLPRPCVCREARRRASRINPQMEL